MVLYCREETPTYFREPFLTKGYRKPESTLTECIKYTLIPHNDVGSFWTHFIPIILWLSYLLHLLHTDTVRWEPYYYPFFCYVLSALTYAACSSFAHCFSPYTRHGKTVCFLFDYLGVSMYAFGGVIGLYFYDRPLGFEIFRMKWLHVCCITFLSLQATLFCSLTRFYWAKWRFHIRAFVYSVPGMLGNLYVSIRFLTCSGREDCVPESFKYHAMCYISAVLAAFFFISKFPERMFPGRFDIVGQSHQLFHFFIVMATSSQIKALLLDSEVRLRLLQNDSVQPTFESTLGMYCLTVLGNFMIVFTLSVLTVKGYLVHQNERKQNSVSNRLIHNQTHCKSE